MSPTNTNTWLKQLSGIRRNLIQDHERVYVPSADFTSLSWRNVGGDESAGSWILRSVEFDLMDYEMLGDDARVLGSWINGEAQKAINDGLVDVNGSDEEMDEENANTNYKFQHEITTMVVLARVAEDSATLKTITLEPILEHSELSTDFYACIHLLTEVTMLAAKRDFRSTGIVTTTLEDVGRLVIQSDRVRCEAGTVVELSFTVVHTFVNTSVQDLFLGILDSLRVIKPTPPEEAYIYTHYY
ncbi:hypothetical protein V5O48_009402 [Marasmius crinis-equi]|uniref:Uncharacterized protein n=1 Tax=Marasmius crinis-equi TaxID=585013 RepID=A0ABR3FBV0_9AGAR